MLKFFIRVNSPTLALPWTGTDAEKGVVVAKMATLGPEILAMAIVPVAEKNK